MVAYEPSSADVSDRDVPVMEVHYVREVVGPRYHRELTGLDQPSELRAAHDRDGISDEQSAQGSAVCSESCRPSATQDTVDRDTPDLRGPVVLEHEGCCLTLSAHRGGLVIDGEDRRIRKVARIAEDRIDLDLSAVESALEDLDRRERAESGFLQHLHYHTFVALRSTVVGVQDAELLPALGLGHLDDPGEQPLHERDLGDLPHGTGSAHDLWGVKISSDDAVELLASSVQDHLDEVGDERELFRALVLVRS